MIHLPNKNTKNTCHQMTSEVQILFMAEMLMNENVANSDCGLWDIKTS